MPARFLGGMDLLNALFIILVHFEVFEIKMASLVSVYFFLKGAFFYNDPNSYIDVFIGIYVWVMVFFFTSWFDYVLIGYLVQKGISCFF